MPHLSDKWGTHSSALFNLELALGQRHTLRGSAEKLGARSMNHPKMREITGWKLQYTEVVRQGGGRATKWDAALSAEHPGREITSYRTTNGKKATRDTWTGEKDNEIQPGDTETID